MRCDIGNEIYGVFSLHFHAEQSTFFKPALKRSDVERKNSN